MAMNNVRVYIYTCGAINGFDVICPSCRVRPCWSVSRPFVACNAGALYGRWMMDAPCVFVVFVARVPCVVCAYGHISVCDSYAVDALVASALAKTLHAHPLVDWNVIDL